MYKDKKIIIISLLIILLISLNGCSTKEKVSEVTENTNTKNITVSGSTSVGPLMEKLAEKYREIDSNTNVEINQLGSSAGIKDAINGTVQMGMSSRDLKSEEKSSGITEVEIAYDGIAIITNLKNKIKSLTIDEIKGIYTGKITNWKDVGGEDGPIVVVSREDGSGTRDAFQEIVGYESKDLEKQALVGDGSGNIRYTVSKNKYAIGFISFEYADNSIHKVEVDEISPTSKNVIDGKYKISRPFLLVYKEDKVSEDGRKFIDFIISNTGQDVVEKSGLIKIK